MLQFASRFKMVYNGGLRGVKPSRTVCNFYESLCTMPGRPEDEVSQETLKLHRHSQSAVIRACLGNLTITALKFMVYLKTGSNAMLSEAIHTLADSGNQVN